MTRLKVIIESPYAGDVERNMKYARQCLLDSIKRGEAPIASHLLYTQVLDDKILDERICGIECGFAWFDDADLIAFYIDYGFSKGMRVALDRAIRLGKERQYRLINEKKIADSDLFGASNASVKTPQD